HSPQLKKPFAMTAVSHASANKKRSERGLCHDSKLDVAREFAFRQRKRIHLSRLDRSNRIHVLSQERGERNQLMQIPYAKQIVLIAEQLVRAVRAQMRRTSQKILRKSPGVCAERGSCFCRHEHRSGPCHGLKMRQVDVRRGEARARTREGIVPMKI